MRILLSGDEGTGTLAAVRGLHDAGHEVWLAVSREDTYAARSRKAAGVIHVADPCRDLEAHALDLVQAAGSLRVDAVLPGTEGSLRALADRGDQFGDDVAVGSGAPEVLARATDKLLLSELARNAGLEAAPTFDLTAPNVELDRLPMPAIVKPRRTLYEAGRRVSVVQVERVANVDELRSLLERGDERLRLLQPYLVGTLAAVCGVAWRGQPVVAVHQRSPRIWPRDHGTSSYAITTPADPTRDRGVAMLVRAIGWSGIFGVQFILTEGHSYVIDFNPRIYGSMALAIAAGANLPAVWAELLAGKRVDPPRPNPGIRRRVEEDDCRVLAALFREGRRADALNGTLPRPRTTHGVFSLRDPRPFAVSLRKLGRLSRLRTGGPR